MRARRRRFDDTTEHLRDTSERLLLERGARAVTLESVSDHGFASVGSVYERWGSRSALLEDLVASRFEVLWTDLERCAPGQLEARLGALMHDAPGQRVGTWIVELLHLARDEPSSGHHAARAVDRLATWCAVGDGLSTSDATARGARWWVLAAVVGHAQLQLGGARMPALASSVTRLASLPDTTPVIVPPVVLPVVGLPEAQYSERPPLDETAARLVGVTRRLISEAGGDTSVRAVLAQTGLAAGSLYRRFASKRALLLGVLEAELAAASYGWVQGLVDAARSDDPIGAMAAVFRGRFDTLFDEVQTRNVILELTARARTDDELRRTVIAQVEQVAVVRAAFFERFAAVGLLAREVTPEVCGWLVQAPAAGFRLLVGAGVTPDGDEVEAGVARVLWNLLSP